MLQGTPGTLPKLLLDVLCPCRAPAWAVGQCRAQDAEDELLKDRGGTRQMEFPSALFSWLLLSQQRDTFVSPGVTG